MVTLAIPVYNMEAYLPRCMDALLAQNRGGFEILLVDDGSTDGSGAMCDGYAAAHPDLVRVVHKENGGLSSARNAGIQQARGECIVFPDPDDWVEPDYVEKLLSHRERWGAELVCTGYFVDTPSGCTPAGQDADVRVMTGPEARRGLLLPPRMNGFAWNKLYCLDIIRENGLRFLDDVGITEDLDFAYRYLACCQTVCFAPAQRTYHYFQREGAATNSGFSPRKLDSLKTYEKIIADCREWAPDLARAAADEICNTAVNLIWMYENSADRSPEAKRFLLRKIRKHLPLFLTGSRYGAGRKVQALLAGFAPGLYAKLKNTKQNR